MKLEGYFEIIENKIVSVYDLKNIVESFKVKKNNKKKNSLYNGNKQLRTRKDCILFLQRNFTMKN